MSNGNFYSPPEAEALYGDIIPAYQAAFAGEPWFERSKCEDLRARCVGGLSSVAVGQECLVCEQRPTRQAYEPKELVERFEALAATRPTDWYIEQTSRGVALAAVAWRATGQTVAAEKYADVPAMADWLPAQLGDQEVVWLDEVFANRAVRSQGNLRNFGRMCQGFLDRLSGDVLAYRTINQRMLKVATRDFDKQARVFTRQQDVPDRRELVIIDRKSRD